MLVFPHSFIYIRWFISKCFNNILLISHLNDLIEIGFRLAKPNLLIEVNIIGIHARICPVFFINIFNFIIFSSWLPWSYDIFRFISFHHIILKCIIEDTFTIGTGHSDSIAWSFNIIKRVVNFFLGYTIKTFTRLRKWHLHFIVWLYHCCRSLDLKLILYQIILLSL